MHPSVTFEERGNVSVGWQKGPRHQFYENRFQLLCDPIPLVRHANRGEIFAVLDGVGSAPKGMAAAQEVCDVLVRFFGISNAAADGEELLSSLLSQANRTIHSWGMIEGTSRPDGACAGTIIWIDGERVAHVYHAGDTLAVLIRDGVASSLTSAHQNCEGHLSNYFGLPVLHLEQRAVQLLEGDRVLMATDGIGKAFFGNQQVADIVEAAPSRQRSLADLFASARASGSSDDATAILIDIEDPDE